MVGEVTAKRVYSQYNLVGQNLRKIVTPIYRKQDFFHAELILDWRKIVGEKFAEAQPIKISGSPALGYCLFLKSTPSLSSQMIYFLPNILERIHQYFGKNFIKNVRFVNVSCIEGKNEATAQRQFTSINIDISYPPLKIALENLAKYI
jgi:hypothetical protein